ncbi:MAG: YeiH family putative sulfate export transporter [Pasteurellaceae bacterium]|nr:YeiH family putative sulfate export transporter [Pasteurellaceae bacterium]
MKKNKAYGLLLVASLATVAWLLSETAFALSWHLSTLTLSILLGMLLGNTAYPHIERYCQSGIQFAKTFLLRAGIVLYGFRLTLQDIHSVGLNAIVTDAIMLVATFFLTCWLGIRWLKIDRQIVQMTAAGCSICGAAAIMATSPIVKAESHKVSVAVALIVIFGTFCMFFYPMIYPYLTGYMSQHQFGIYIGSSVHEVAQVYAAGSNINSTVADTAVISKMIRVMMLAPFLVVLSYYLQRESRGQSQITIPWFAIWFVAVAIFNSLNLLPPTIVNWLVQMDSLLLMMAMSALGLTTQLNAVKQAGLKPLLLGALVCLWLIIGGFFVNVAMAQLG